MEFFRYNPGALISYWDTSYSDNNVGDHPGAGEILPVDAHPNFNHAPDGTLLRPRILSYDSTFSTKPRDQQTIHYLGRRDGRAAGQAAVAGVRRHPGLVVRPRRARHG